jgi:predicted aldo/keto reductase-like oxidoreductase
MLYREYGHTGKMVSALGIGTMRLDKDDEAGSVAVVRTALEQGCNFIDVAPGYVGGRAEAFVGKAIAGYGKSIYITTKSSSVHDPTADALRQRLDISLKRLNVSRVAFYCMWSVMSGEQYEFIMRPGGPYEGAARAKEEGLIEHIVFSAHCDEATMLRMIESGYFEGVTLSVNLMNYESMKGVCHAAKKAGLGVATMNSLGGGIIPQNAAFFEKRFPKMAGDLIPQLLRMNAALPGVSVVLSGMRTLHETVVNAVAFAENTSNTETDLTRLSRAMRLCTGCGYCVDTPPCPAGIQIPAYMSAYNFTVLFNAEYSERLRAQKVFSQLRNLHGIIPEICENPCLDCGQCEKKCTQHLPIRECLDQMYRWVAQYNYHLSHMKLRISGLFTETEMMIGVTPAGDWTDVFLMFVLKYFPEYRDRMVLIDINPDSWGKNQQGVPIHAPADMPALDIGILLIVHYRMQDKIYEEYRDLRISVEKLYRQDDIMWFGW